MLGSGRKYSLPGSRLSLPASPPETRQPGRGPAQGAVDRTLDRPPLPVGGRLHTRCQVDPTSCGRVGQTGALQSLQPGACAQNTEGSRGPLRGHSGRSVPRHPALLPHRVPGASATSEGPLSPVAVDETCQGDFRGAAPLPGHLAPGRHVLLTSSILVAHLSLGAGLATPTPCVSRKELAGRKCLQAGQGALQDPDVGLLCL